MIEQMVHEKARIQIRHEQVSEANYFTNLSTNISKTDEKIGEEKTLNKKLILKQKANTEEIFKYQQQKFIIPDEEKVSHDRTMKQLSEELSRTHWWISEKEKSIKALEDKQMAFMIKQNKVKQRHEQLKKEYDDIIMAQPELLENQYRALVNQNTHGHDSQSGTMTQVDTINKKLLVEQWAKQSKQQYLDNEMKKNEKYIVELS